MTLREKIIEQVGNYEYDGIIDNQEEIITDSILSLFKQAIEEAKPKDKEIRYEEIDTGIGIDRLEYDGQEKEHSYNKGISDYHSALMEKLT